MPASDHDLILPLLEKPLALRVVSSLLRPDLRPARDRRHLEWTLAHGHAHPLREILVPLRGECRYGFRREVYACRPGVVFLFDREEAHDLNYPPTAGAITHLWLVFSQGMAMSRILRVQRGRIQASSVRPVVAANASARCMLDAWDAVAAGAGARADCRRRRLLLALGNLLFAVHDNFAANPESSPEEQQRRAIDLVCRHLAITCGKGDSTDALARLAGMSKYHFLRVFKKHTGSSVHTMINHLRVRRTRELLAQGRLKKEIAAVLGFASPVSFSRWLRDSYHGRRERRS